MINERDLTRGLKGFTLAHSFKGKEFIIRVISVKEILSNNAVVLSIMLNDTKSQCICSINDRVLDPYLKIRKGDLVLKRNQNDKGLPDLQIDIADIGERVLEEI